MSSQHIAAIRELNERQRVRDALRASCFKEQLDFIDDPSKLKLAQCTRRAGKTFGAGGIYAVDTALWYPESTLLYICTTRDTARRILLKDVLYPIKRKHNIQMSVNLQSLMVTFPKSNSVLYLLGLDSKPEEADKALGQKYKLVIIDEGGNWKQDQHHMIHSVLEPACADNDGTICMIGAPSNNLKTYFYDICGRSYLDPAYRGQGWSVHKWGWWNNPHMAEKMAKRIALMKERNPLVEETPIYKQMYLNEWVVDPSALVYKYSDERNTATELPKDHHWIYTLGIDLGYEDDSAFVLSAYSPTHPHMFFCEAIKRKHQDITDVANILGDFKSRYPISKWIVDGASKQAVQELVKRHGFPLIPADKRGKTDMIEIMNADFTTGAIKLLDNKCDILKDEYGNLIWDKTKVPKEEHPACPNHGADAALYGWRANYHFTSREPEKKVKPGSEEAMEQWWEREAERGARSQRQQEDFVKSDWGKEYG